MKKTLWLAAAIVLAFRPALAGQSITVASPVASDHWLIGSTHAITWTSLAVTGEVAIKLRTPEGGITNVKSSMSNTGSFSWTIPNTVVPGTYKIRVRTVADDPLVYGDSPFFTIASPPAPISGLSVESPRGGENWEIGSTQAIAWIATNLQENCRLYLLKDGQVKGLIRDSFPPGSGLGSWNWKVGDYQGGTATAGGGYTVRMELVGGSFSASSNAPFTIVPQPIVFPRPLKKEIGFVLPARPDLVVCLAWDGKRPYMQEDKRIYVKFKNKGPGPSPAAAAVLYVEANGDTAIQVPALAANEEFTFSKKFDWATTGEKTVRATVDPQDQIKEGNENNNSLARTIRVILPLQDRYVAETQACSDQP